MAPRLPAGHRRRALSLATTLALAGAWPLAAAAHGFGQRFDLPVPLWLWLVAAGLTLLLSFAAVIDFLPPSLERVDYPRLPLRRLGIARLLTGPLTVWPLRAIALVLFLATIVAGLAGNPDPNANLAPTMVWVVFWVGMAFASALFGDIWQAINPFDTLYRPLAGLFRALTARGPGEARAYPQWLGAWSAVALMLVFAWGEHLWAGAAVPFRLALALLVYTAITLAGMLWFGRRAWLAHGEVFSIVFGLFARFAPLGLSPVGAAREPVLRPPAVALLDARGVAFPMTVFVLLVLSGVTFDGFLETPLWADWLATATALTGLGAVACTTLALVLCPLLFLLAYLLGCALMRLAGGADAGGARPAFSVLVSRFVMTLVPIAVAYHVAHYLTLLTNAGQAAIPLLSDPLGRGDNLFGTAGYQVNPALLGVRTVWYIITGLIVTGHVLSVWLAHLVALDVYASRRRAVRSQVPMLALMVAYTMLSLWILAQPIVG